MQSRKFDLRRVRDWVSGSLVLLVVLAGGAGLGYWYGTENMRAMLADTRQAHVDEIARLQEANQRALEATAGSVQRAAESVAKVAATPKVIRQIAPAPPASLDAQRRAVNISIQRANGQLAETEGSTK